jgi:hypothetical protein
MAKHLVSKKNPIKAREGKYYLHLKEEGKQQCVNFNERSCSDKKVMPYM